MKIPVPNGGGSGSGSDECTAVAADILEGKTAIFDGSNDEPDYGTMVEYAGSTHHGNPSLDTSNNRLLVGVANEGHYDTTANLYVNYSDLASTVGLTAAMIATGQSVMGLVGTYTGLGSAAENQVIEGATFSTSTLSNATGTMPYLGGTSSEAEASVSNNTVRLKTPAVGYYNLDSYLYTSYSSLASVIGLTAAKLGTGQSVLGITGTYKPTVKEISSVSYGGSYWDSDSDGSVSYTCPADGTCYYGGISCCYWGTSAPNITCEISKNGVVQDSRNITSNDDPDVRATMVDKSFSVSAGDVITVNTACTTPRYVALAMMQAVIVTYT